jgi:putative transposase
VSLYRLIGEESDRQSVSRLCRTLGVTRSGYYDWQRQPLSDRALADWLLTEQIRVIFEESEQTYGSPRIFKGAQARPRHADRGRSASPG